MSFEKAIGFSLPWEGGATFTDDPDDPGGATKYGISKRAHPDVDIPNLTEDQAKAIYEHDYYLAAGCDQLDEPLDLVVFDAAVNLGVHRALDFLNEATNAGGNTALVVCQERDAYYADLAHRKPEMGKYLHGWLRRTADLRRVAGLL